MDMPKRSLNLKVQKARSNIRKTSSQKMGKADLTRRRK